MPFTGGSQLWIPKTRCSPPSPDNGSMFARVRGGDHLIFIFAVSQICPSWSKQTYLREMLQIIDDFVMDASLRDSVDRPMRIFSLNYLEVLANTGVQKTWRFRDHFMRAILREKKEVSTPQEMQERDAPTQEPSLRATTPSSPIAATTVTTRER